MFKVLVFDYRLWEAPTECIKDQQMQMDILKGIEERKRLAAQQRIDPRDPSQAYFQQEKLHRPNNNPGYRRLYLNVG